MQPSSVKVSAVADIIIGKLAAAGDPPAAPRVQALMILVAAAWHRNNPSSRPWDDRLIVQQNGSIVWKQLYSALHHHKGQPIVPPENHVRLQNGINQVSSNETPPSAELLGCVDEVLDRYAGTSPYHLWKAIMATQAVQHPNPGQYATTVEVDVVALGEQLSGRALASV